MSERRVGDECVLEWCVVGRREVEVEDLAAFVAGDVEAAGVSGVEAEGGGSSEAPVVFVVVVVVVVLRHSFMYIVSLKAEAPRLEVPAPRRRRGVIKVEVDGEDVVVSVGGDEEEVVGVRRREAGPLAEEGGGQGIFDEGDAEGSVGDGAEVGAQEATRGGVELEDGGIMERRDEKGAFVRGDELFRALQDGDAGRPALLGEAPELPPRFDDL
eukprot:CAMPEP_0118915242 /NCGR_PEP_ID=MMETSP1166-20130328/15440_1 /TAXON_ID=1104430 /ORGANISM="Chrysoreinhardia sp, Strain CCMP3193" /LENGTH=212 /DNA_ID=CAMNT_0006854905 /DNA_START=49 /DNA_END=684 /DNA_ORIENTATION=+